VNQRLALRVTKPSQPARLRYFLLAVLWALALCLLPLHRARAVPLLGANLDPSFLTPETQATELARLAHSGVSSVRLLLDWNRVEPQPNHFTWDAYDALIDAARAQNLDVVLVLGPCAEWAVDPAWQVPPDQRSYSLPKSSALWERYVRQAVSHFRGRVRAWQVRRHPNVVYFRGARSEYLRLLAAAARVARSLDPDTPIVVPEPGSLGIATFDELLHSDAAGNCDILGFYLPSVERGLSEPALAWAALTHQVLDDPDLPSRPPLWILAPEPDTAQDCLIAHYLLASAFGVERCYLPLDAIGSDWHQALAQLEYRGFLRLGPDLWALLFEGPQGTVVAAWSARERELPAADLAPVSDPEAVRNAAPLGGPAGSAVVVIEAEAHSPEPPVLLRLGPRPILIAGLDAETCARPGAPTSRDVLAARPGLDLQHVPLVYADYSMDLFPEFGLRNRELRTLRGGDIEEEARTGRPCLRTFVSPRREEDKLGDPYLYFDIDDAWLYFARGRVPVAITVECERAFAGEKKLGFNIMYDSTAGYRFTDWQWVDPGDGWSTYRFLLDDVSFANRSGFDFRINAKGSKQDLWVAAVTVEKAPPQPQDDSRPSE
jgi:hypothetical protein